MSFLTQVIYVYRSFRPSWVQGAFAVSFLWWAYLFFTTQIVVVYDAEGYEELGKLLAHQGWTQFLQNGPQREPMFPCLVALSMQMGHWWGISYFYPLKIIGLLFLFLTMLFSYRLMGLLSVRPSIAALVLLYMGLSPVMTNSSMRLWSEFAAYPWVVLAVIWTIKSWKMLDGLPQDRHAYPKIARHAAVVAFMFLLIMSVKAVAEGVVLFYLWPFYRRIFLSLRSRDFIKARQVIVFCLVVLAVFEGCVCAYKLCNYRYNGNFAFTNRGDWAFYGNTARRMQPLTLKSLGTAAAYVPGMGICTALYGPRDCDFWSAHHSDELISQKMTDLNKRKITGEAASRYYIHDSIKMILSNPLQAILLMAVEAHKMFFWESSVDFMVYPDWLDRLLHSAWFLYSLRTIFAVFSWGACAFAFWFLCRRPHRSSLNDKAPLQALFWTINFVFWYMAMYSFYFILDRYSFPLISLYLVLISFLIDRSILAAIGGASGNLPLDHSLKIPGKQYLGPALMALLAMTQAAWFWAAPGNFKAVWAQNPLVAHIIKEHQRVDEKTKFATLSYSAPYFVYFANTVSGTLQPKIALQQGYYDYYHKAVELFPDVDSLHFLLGFCEYYKGNLEAAQAQYEKSAELNPDFFWSYYNLGVIYFQQGEFIKSALILNKALSLTQETSLVDLNRNPFYWQIWRYVDDPQKVLGGNLREGMEDAALLLAACLVKGQRYDQVLQIIQSIGQADPWHHELWEKVRQIALKRGPLANGTFLVLQEQIPVRLF